MVSEVGMLVMARVLRVSPEVTLPLNAETMLEIERVVFGGDRFQVGCQLLRLWGFSSSIIDAISHLSTPTSPPTDGLGWYLAAARRLVLDDGFAPAELNAPPGSVPEIDHALELMRSTAKTMESV
jgi:HD-like signal output (HDOD) protein